MANFFTKKRSAEVAGLDDESGADKKQKLEKKKDDESGADKKQKLEKKKDDESGADKKQKLEKKKDDDDIVICCKEKKYTASLALLRMHCTAPFLAVDGIDPLKPGDTLTLGVDNFDRGIADFITMLQNPFIAYMEFTAQGGTFVPGWIPAPFLAASYFGAEKVQEALICFLANYAKRVDWESSVQISRRSLGSWMRMLRILFKTPRKRDSEAAWAYAYALTVIVDAFGFPEARHLDDVKELGESRLIFDVMRAFAFATYEKVVDASGGESKKMKINFPGLMAVIGSGV